MRHAKRLVSALSLVTVFGLTAVACGDDDQTSDTTEAPAASEPTDSGAPTTDTGASPTTEGGAETTDAGSVPDASGLPPVNIMYDVTGRGDKSFNDAAAAGIDQARDEFGVQFVESTPTGDGDRAQRLQLAIDSNDGPIFAIGFLWGPTVTQAAAANAETQFAIVDEIVDAPNVSSLTFAEEQGSFLVGVAAALKTQTNHVGFIGGVQIALIQKFEAGFRAGVAAVNPDILVDVAYITQPPDFTGFNDPAKGKEIAAGMYEAGADVIYSAAGGSGLGAFEAAKDAGAPGEVWAIGVDSDQYNLVSADLQPYILTSMLKRVDVAVYEAAKAYASGTLEPGQTIFDLEAEGVGYSTSGGFLDDITDQIDEFADQIISGEIEVPTAPS